MPVIYIMMNNIKMLFAAYERERKRQREKEKGKYIRQIDISRDVS